MDDNYRFDGFTEQARKIVNRAEAEARRFQHNAYGVYSEFPLATL